MSLFQRLSRTLRPASFSATSTFRATTLARAPRLDLNFFGNGKLTRMGMYSMLLSIDSIGLVDAVR